MYKRCNVAPSVMLHCASSYETVVFITFMCTSIAMRLFSEIGGATLEGAGSKH